jgi:rare lipoprotein A
MERRSITGYRIISAEIIICVLLLAACAGRVVPPPTSYPPGLPPSQRPYEVNGVRYYPIPSALGYVEKGIASWYGDDFHGKATSSGEPYDMYAMTAAHKTLPLGTHVKVTSMRNSSSLIVRINDRGPFVSGRIIDLSYSAAQRLGMAEAGTAPVLVEAVQVATSHKVDGATVWEAEAVPDFRFGNFTIQIGAFQQVGNALRVREVMREDYDEVRIQPPSYYDRDRFYRVQVGRFNELAKAQKAADALKQDRFPDAFVVAVDE